MSIAPILAQFLPWITFSQGLLLAGAVATRWKLSGNRYLAVFLFLLSIHGVAGLAWQDPTNAQAVVLGTLLSVIPFLYGPLVYRYVWHSLHREFRDPVPFWVHRLPAAVNLAAYTAILAIVGVDEFVAIARDVFSGRAPVAIAVVEWVKILHGVTYAFFILRLLRRNRAGLDAWVAREARRRWLSSLVRIFAATWFLVLISGIMLFGPNTAASVRLSVTAAQLVFFLLLIYTVTYFALRYPAVLEPKARREAVRRQLNLPEGFVEEALRRLARAEGEEFFRDESVTLPTLARRVGIHPNALSFILNEERGMGFRSYVNHLRLDAFVSAAESADEARTHLEMAMEAGFASKSTFLRAFRARFATTPSDYLASSGTNSHT